MKVGHPHLQRDRCQPGDAHPRLAVPGTVPGGTVVPRRRRVRSSLIIRNQRTSGALTCAAPRRSARRRALPARPLGKPVKCPLASTSIWANSLRSNSATSPPPGICRWRERLASKALLGESFGEVAAHSMLRGFAATHDITVAGSRLRATVDRHPAARVDHRSSQARSAWAAEADRRASARPPERLGRKERSSHGAGEADERPQAGTGAVRARDHRVRGRARVRRVLVMAGGRSTAVTRRSWRASRSGEAAGSAAPLGGRPGRRLIKQ